MTRCRAIELAIELATRQRDELAKRHAQAVRNLEFANQQMAQLQGYAQEVDARLLAQGAASMAIELVQNHYQFTERLQQAVTLQEGVIINMQRLCDNAHRALLQGEFKLAGLKQVLQTRQAAVQKTLARREQRATDEFAAMRHIQRSAERSQGETL